VQFLPNYISPLFNDAIQEAHEIEFEDTRSKIVGIEYLVVLLRIASNETVTEGLLVAS